MARRRFDTIDEFILIKELAKGEFACIYLGYEKGSEQKYAIKALLKPDKIHVEDFKREASIMEQIRDERVIKFLKFKEGKFSHNREESNVWYLVLEFAEGGCLIDHLEKLSGKCLKESVARSLLLQIVEGLESIHAKGFGHCDLKPENIFFDKLYNLKIGDFGSSSKLEKPLILKSGTDGYQAPEILKRKNYHGHEVDIFALGVIVFIFAFGHPPFESASRSDELYNMLLKKNYSDYWECIEKPCSEELKDLVQSLLSDNPINRPTIRKIKAHPWFKQPCAPKYEILKDLEIEENDAAYSIIDKNGAEINESKSLLEESEENTHNLSKTKALVMKESSYLKSQVQVSGGIC